MNLEFQILLSNAEINNSFFDWMGPSRFYRPRRSHPTQESKNYQTDIAAQIPLKQVWSTLADGTGGNDARLPMLKRLGLQPNFLDPSEIPMSLEPHEVRTLQTYMARSDLDVVTATMLKPQSWVEMAKFPLTAAKPVLVRQADARVRKVQTGKSIEAMEQCDARSDPLYEAIPGSVENRSEGLVSDSSPARLVSPQSGVQSCMITQSPDGSEANSRNSTGFPKFGAPVPLATVPVPAGSPPSLHPVCDVASLSPGILGNESISCEHGAQDSATYENAFLNAPTSPQAETYNTENVLMMPDDDNKDLSGTQNVNDLSTSAPPAPISAAPSCLPKPLKFSASSTDSGDLYSNMATNYSVTQNNHSGNESIVGANLPGEIVTETSQLDVTVPNLIGVENSVFG